MDRGGRRSTANWNSRKFIVPGLGECRRPEFQHTAVTGRNDVVRKCRSRSLSVNDER